ncbi:MAG: hypothetical protein AAGD25_04690 [Cyanobacteria bacterium P01_F01_bin.150]
MKTEYRVLQRLSLLGACVIFGSVQGCRIGSRSIESLQEIHQYPTTVTVEGIVGDRVPLVNQYLYELEDASGTIWVQSAGDISNMAAQQRIQVKGKLQHYSMPEFGSGYGELLIKELSHQVIE